MKKLLQGIVSAVLILGLVSCQMAGIVGEEEIETPTKIETIDDIPEFSPLAIYVIGREFEHSNQNCISENKVEIAEYENYLENRLIDLYPNMAYKGIVADMQNVVENTIGMELRKISETDTLDFRPFTTLEDEFEYMNMSEEEIEYVLALEALATSETPFELEDIEYIENISLRKESAYASIEAIILVPTVVVAILIYGYITYLRCRISEDRARDKVDDDGFYSGKMGSGQKGDVFRHTYVNVLIRECCGQAVAWAASLAYEAKNWNNFVGDRQMDFHNNKVGRRNDGQYKNFIKDAEGNKGDYHDWANRVRDFINMDRNGVKMDWIDGRTNRSEILIDLQDVTYKKYVYYKR